MLKRAKIVSPSLIGGWGLRTQSQLDFPPSLQYRIRHAPVAQLDRAAVS